MSNLSISGPTGSIFGLTGSTSISGSNLIYSSVGITLATPKSKYHILGEEVEVKGHYQDSFIAMNISTLNVLGKPFLDELHKNGVFFPTEIEEYLEKKFKWLERDKKIDDIIN